MARFLLVYSHPELGERRFELENGRTYRIGSKPDNDLVLEQSDVSRYHAILRVRDGTFHITDLGSKNGTYVNGHRAAAATCQCGDLINLSSARMVLVEVGSGGFPPAPEVGAGGAGSDGAREETLGFLGAASAEDMVSLLVTTSEAVRHGAVAEPLSWAVDRLGVLAALVLYRDADDHVAMVSSAGELGILVRSSDTLARLAREQRGHRPAARIQQVNALGETLLVAPMQRDHVLVVRFEGAPPAIGDVRALIAAVESVLCSGNLPSGALTATDRRDPETRRFGSPVQRIAGLSEAIGDCRRRVVELARGDQPVMITGESGTGKSLVARVIHDLSGRCRGPFVAYRRDATVPAAAVEARFNGAVAEARGGTLLVKELSRLSREQQARLAELLEGSGAGEREVRVVGADTRDPDPAVAAGRLDSRLLTGLGPLCLHLPPLRERTEDIPLLATIFQREGGSRAPGEGGFSPDALVALASYGWPGNLRELRCEVLRLMATPAKGRLVEVSDLAPAILEGLAGQEVPPPDLAGLARRTLGEARAEFERWRILRALHDSGGNQSDAARRLGLSRAGLFKMMRRLGLAGEGWRGPSPGPDQGWVHRVAGEQE